ncbi:MAG: alpha/beta hydrolase family protein [Pseudomonadales bacterium]
MRFASYLRLLAVALLQAPFAAATESGFQLETFTDSRRDRPVLIDWWYPVEQASASAFNYGLGAGRVVEAGTVAKGPFPLILLSHGALGAARNYSWIAEALARSGYIVAGVSHYGESYVFGAGTVDPQAVLRHWERPADISAAIDHITSASGFRHAIDPQRIGFLGHSSGGATALQLAGARLDSQQMGSYCASPRSASDRGCDYADGVDDAIEPTDRMAPSPQQSYQDDRLRAFVALDPALGPAFNDYSMIPADLPILLIASTDNDFLPFEHYAEVIAKGLPQAQTHWLGAGEGHFVYLNQCQRDIAANGVALCRDRPGVSRSATHQTLQQHIIAFFRNAL